MKSFVVISHVVLMTLYIRDNVTAELPMASQRLKVELQDARETLLKRFDIELKDNLLSQDKQEARVCGLAMMVLDACQ